MLQAMPEDVDARDKPAHDGGEVIMAEPNRRSAAATVPNDLESFWMPFTPNRAFKRAPRLIARAKDMHYYTPRGPRRARRHRRAVVHQCRP